MARIHAIRERSKKHHDKAVEVLRAVTAEDEAWEPSAPKTVVKLEDGTEFVVLNDEVRR